MSKLARYVGLAVIAIMLISILPLGQSARAHSTRAVGAVISEPVNGYTCFTLDQTTFNGSASTVGVGQNITNYQWYFDNGDVISGPDKGIVSYAFPKAGNYAVTLTVSNSVGETSSTTINVTILNRAPEAKIKIDPPEPTAASPVVFDGSQSSDLDGMIVNWTWSIGGVPMYGQSVVRSFPDDGNYSVSLTVIDDNGATNKLDSWVIVQNKLPNVNFNWTPARPNVGQTITFTSVVSDEDGTVLDANKLWFLGDGVVHTGASTTFSYPARGTYNVTFSATDNDGGVSFVTKYIYVGFTPPVPSVIVVDGAAKLTLEEFQFDASASYDPDGTIISYVWDFGDTTTATGAVATHQYSDGTMMGRPYNVKLNVTDNDFNWSTLTIVVNVFNRPPLLFVPDIVVNNSVGSGALVSFDSTACYDPDGSIVNYTWRCGDGQFAYGPSATHWYANDGIYNVNLTATDDDGAVTYTNFTVIVLNLAPHASISYSPSTVTAGVPVNFNGASSYDPDGSIVSYQWYFSDTNTTLGGSSASHTFAQNGSYLVRLTVMDDDGMTNVSVVRISVGNLAPIVDAGEKIRTYYTLTQIGFDASNSYDTDGTITGYTWFFGDGTSASGVQVTHAYSDNGNYTVLLTITDNDGAVNTTTVLIHIVNRPPTAFCPSLAALTYQNVTFNAGGSSDADGYIVSYLWKFHDGTFASGIEVVKNYAENGVYPVVLEVVDNDGATGNVSIEVTISNREPYARISSSDAFPMANTPTGFFGSNSTDIDGIIVNWTWYMGDGSVKYGTNVTHTYTSNGTFFCYLIVTDNDGAMNTARLKVKVGNLYPVAQITASPMTAFTNETILFSGMGSFDLDDPTNASMIANYQWNFGDGTSAFGMNTTHQYMDGTRTYNVVLIVTDLDGASNSTQVQITIYNREPQTALTDVQTTTLVSTLLEGSYCYDTDGMIVNYTWTLSGATPIVIGYGADIHYTFIENGVFEVILTIRDDDGATNSTSMFVTVANRAPHALFTYEPHGAMEALPVNFSAMGSYDEDGSIVTYHWIFGDGAEADGMNVSHTYVNNGSYEAILTVVDNDGDLNQYSVMITVVEHNILPHALVSTNMTGEVYTYQLVYFNASSSYDEDGFLKWYQWNFGDGTQLGGNDKVAVSHYYVRNNTYTVTLTVIDDKSGQGVFEMPVTILNSAPIAYAGPDKTVLTNSTMTFDATAVQQGQRSYDIDGTITNFTWTCNGVTRYGRIVSYFFPTNGVFTLSLTVRDDCNASSTDTAQITVLNRAPVAIGGPDVAIDSNSSVVLSADDSYDPDGTIVAYLWTFDDGTTQSTINAMKSYSYLQKGMHIVNLTVTDDDGGKNSTFVKIYVRNKAPTPVVQTSVETALTYTDITFSAAGSTDPDGAVVKWAWMFGDGNVGSGETITHQYKKMGVYTVTVTVTDNNGTSMAIPKTITITNRLPTASFTYSPASNIMSLDTVFFYANDSSDTDGFISSYSWDIGSGNKRTGKIVSYAFPEPGTYEVRLTVTDDNGGSVVTTKTIVVGNRAPVVDVGAIFITCKVKEMRTYDASKSYDPDGTIVNYTWQMNKDQADTMVYGAVISYKFPKAGNYTTVLTVTDNNGTKTTLELFVMVEKLPGDTRGNNTPDFNIGEIIFAFIASLALLQTARIVKRRRI